MTREQQRAASLLWNKAPTALQLIAGAGSGKTTTLVNAVLQAQQHYARQSEIAVITFTRKAAYEMRERLAKADGQAGFIGTIHALAYRLLKHDAQFSLLRNGDHIKATLLRNLLPSYAHIPVRFLLTSALLSDADKLKLEQAYQNYKNQHNYKDFDDLISMASTKPEFRHLYKVVFVDEFQDTSPDQVAFIQNLAAKKLFVVGDDWQSIYKFRGADVSITVNFNTYFPGATRLFLTKNFRSTSQIVRLGNKAIRLSSQFVKKKLVSHHGRGPAPRLFLAKSANPPFDAARSYQDWRIKKGDGSARTFLVRTNLLRAGLEPLLLPGDTISTIHSAKGLEFDAVTIYGVAQHILPHRDGDFDEETRLFYVAITRARKHLDFVAWEDGTQYSPYLPFLVKHCRLRYI